ncbi:hypothetical protein BWR60_35740, partial [Inquilinus limosus]
MVDSFHGLFWCCRAARPGRPIAAKRSSVTVDQAEIDVCEADDPVAGLGLGDADGFADQGLGDEDLVALP